MSPGRGAAERGLPVSTGACYYPRMLWPARHLRRSAPLRRSASPRRTPLAGLLPLCLLLLAARVDAAERVDELIQQARDAYGLADFDKAIGLLDRARQVARPGAELAAVHAERAIVVGETRGLEPARPILLDALRQDPNACPDRARAKGNLVDLCATLRAAGRARLLVSGQAGRTVLVDGQKVGVVPLDQPVPIGEHVIEVPGRRSTLQRRATLALEATLRVEVPAEAAESADQPRVGDASAPPPPAPRRRPWAWATAGLAAGLAVASLGCWLGSEKGYSSWQDITHEPPSAERAARLADQQASVQRLEKASWALLGTAAATAIVSGILFWREGRESSRPRVQAWLPHGAAGLLFSSDL
jgi:hypothetical protein